MKKIKASFVVVTPMFLGESPSDKNVISCAERIRGASVKGALRAYFRALNWSGVREKSASTQEALNKLHQEEAFIFGAAVKDKRGGQAKFLLRIKGSSIAPKRSLVNQDRGDDEIKYLLGMGLFHFKDGLLRDYIPEGTEFEIELLLNSRKDGLTTEQVQQVKNSLLAFGLLGGLGSRARKGFGSVTIQSLSVDGREEVLPNDREQYIASIRKLLGESLIREEPPFSAYSALTRLQISGQDKEPIHLLRKHGQEMGLYRGYGQNHKVFKKPAEQNFSADHDWAYDLTKGEADTDYLPERAIFGLPHPYFLSGAKFKVDVDSTTGRRASPLMTHIHRLPTGDHLLVHTLIRSVFLPKQAQVQVKTKSQSYKLSNVSNKVDWQVLDGFLERFNPRKEDLIHG